MKIKQSSKNKIRHEFPWYSKEHELRKCSSGKHFEWELMRENGKMRKENCLGTNEFHKMNKDFTMGKEKSLEFKIPTKTRMNFRIRSHLPKNWYRSTAHNTLFCSRNSIDASLFGKYCRDTCSGKHILSLLDYFRNFHIRYSLTYISNYVVLTVVGKRIDDVSDGRL